MDRIGNLLAVSFVLLLALSCSGSFEGPVGPGFNESPGLSGQSETGSVNSSTQMWGLWEIRIDPVNKTSEVVPLRGIMYACNINKFIDGPPSNLLLQDMTVEDAVGYTDISVDVGLRHPFPGATTFTGFDVMGVFLGMGSGVYHGTATLQIPNQYDQRLLNPDGYTRWFNRPEFKTAGEQLHLFGYDPGRAGTQTFYPTSKLNGFKYFTDGLGNSDNAFDHVMANPDQRGSFNPGQTNYRRYQIRFPDIAGIVFQYAVIAHWEEHANYPGLPSGLDDFPISANSSEAVLLSTYTNDSTLFYTSGSSGGVVIMDISPWDWSAEPNVSGVMEEYDIKCFSTGWDGAYDVDMTPVAQADNFCTYHAEIPVDSLSSPDPLPVWVEISYPGLDYSNPFGVPNLATGLLTSYFQVSIPIDTELPYWISLTTPNGGEVWVPGTDEEITWTSQDVPGTVDILYSKDHFVSDVHTIAAGEVNDGSFTWNIPLDPSQTVRVRVRSTDIPSVYDSSDSDFEIFGPWIHVTIPNGGEVWPPGSSKAINWTSGNMTGTVFIEYSKDNFVSDINTIVTNETDDGSYTWIDIPYDPSTTVKVRISSTDNPSIYDTSDANFTIESAANWILVLDPNGGEKFMAGSNHSILWDSEYVTGTVFMEYSKDNFVSDFHTIATNETNDGSYVWANIPSDVSNTVRVRVSSTDTPSINDKSDADFAVAANAGWVQTWGDTNDDEGTGTVVDASGNYYVVGTFKDTTDFDPGGGVSNRTSNGAKDVFVSRFDAAGNLVWVQSWGGIGDDVGNGIALDGAGGIYVTGQFYDTVDFDPGAGTQNRSSNGGPDVYLSKLDTAGNYQWALAWGGSETDQGLGVAAVAGTVYVTGSYINTVDFNPGAGTDNRTSQQDSYGYYTADVYLSSFTSAGVYNWVQVWGGNVNDFGQAVGVDGFGFVCVAGWFQSTVDFNPSAGTDNRTSQGVGDSFLSRFSSAGAYQWARTWGGSGSDANSGIFVEPTGNIFVTGKFEGTVDFDPGAGTDSHTSAGASDATLSGFNSTGTYLYGRSWGGTGVDSGYAVALDGSSNTIVTGTFEGTVDFDPGAGTDSEASNGNTDGFASMFNAAGTYQWVNTWGAESSESARGAAFSGSGEMYITGGFKSMVDFAPTEAPCSNNSDQRTSNGKIDVYLIKYLATGCW